MHIVLANPVEKTSTVSHFPLIHLSNSSSHSVHKAENECAETVVPPRVTERYQGTMITVGFWNNCSIMVLPGMYVR